MRYTETDLANIQRAAAAVVQVMMPKQSKYRSQKTQVNGITFASKLEAKRWGELKLLQQAGKITDLERQVKYVLTAHGCVIGRYVADYEFYDLGARKIVTEDCKGFKTALYRWKRKHWEAQTGRKLIEILK